MPTVHANGIDIRYEVLGPEGQTPLVLTHGLAGPADNWLPELGPLIERRRIIMHDVRGHGRTTVPESLDAYSMPTFAADLAALLRAVGVERAHIGGESMGGMITAQFAVDFPEMCESVLLCDTTCGNGCDEGPGGEWERQMQRGISMLMHLAKTYGLEETIRREQAYKLENDPHLNDSPYAFEGDFERMKLMTLPGYLGAAHAIVTRPDLTNRIPGITAPTLVMCGEWDDFLPCARRDHELIRGSRMVVRKRCGHGTLWRAETFVSEVLGFAEDVDAGREVAEEREV